MTSPPAITAAEAGNSAAAHHAAECHQTAAAFSVMRLIIGPMVCIIAAKRRLPIFAFIISSIGAICVIISWPPPPAAELRLCRR